MSEKGTNQAWDYVQTEGDADPVGRQLIFLNDVLTDTEVTYRVGERNRHRGR